MKPRAEIKASAREALRSHRGTSIGLVLVPLVIIMGLIMLIAMFSLPYAGTLQSAVEVASGKATRVSMSIKPTASNLTAGALFVAAMLFVMLSAPALDVTLDGGFTQLYRGDDVSVGHVMNRWFQRWGRKIWVYVLIGWFTFWWGVLFELPAAFLGAVATNRMIISPVASNLLVGVLSMVSIITSVAYSIFVLRYMLAPYLIAEYPGLTAREAVGLSVRMTRGHRTELFIAELSFIGWIILSAFTFMIVGIAYAIPYIQTTMAGYYVELRNLALTSGAVAADELGDSSYVN